MKTKIKHSEWINIKLAHPHEGREICFIEEGYDVEPISIDEIHEGYFKSKSYTFVCLLCAKRFSIKKIKKWHYFDTN